LKNWLSGKRIYLTVNRRKVFKWFLIILAIVAVVAITLYFFRNPILQSYVNKKITNFNQKYNAELRIGDIKLKGISQLEINGLSLKPINGDTLIKTRFIHARINLWKLLLRRVGLRDLELSDTYISLIQQDSINNYSFLLKKTSKQNAVESDTIPNYNEKFYQLFNAIFDKIPSQLKITNFNASSSVNGHVLSLHIDHFNITDRAFKSWVVVKEENQSWRWIVDGKLDAYNRTAVVKWYCPGRQKVVLPYLQYKWKADVTFDTIQFNLAESQYSHGVFSVNGFASIKGLEIQHAAISNEKVIFNKAALSYRVNIGKDYFELDSLSTATINKLDINPYIKYRPHPSKQITLIINKPNFPSQNLFESLPQGLFSNLQGIQTSGELSYHLKFIVDFAHPDNLVFESSLDRNKFHIDHFGRINLSFFNAPFSYTAYEHGVPVRTFMVGPENPNFHTLDQISPYLKDAVMTSEDGAFYGHRGFLPEAFKNAIAADIKQKRFARGGSTISMQLVKNVFLTRNKTISRKLEEVLIVWLIENNGLSTKDRMLEVYLNIIEWGPMIYGAQEASQFYFSKDASQLTLAEAIYMASIIPHPKWFMYSFETDGHLKEFLGGFYNLMSQKMLHKEYITEADQSLLVPDVVLTGPAKDLLLKADTLATPIDSLKMDLELPADEL